MVPIEAILKILDTGVLPEVLCLELRDLAQVEILDIEVLEDRLRQVILAIEVQEDLHEVLVVTEALEVVLEAQVA